MKKTQKVTFNQLLESYQTKYGKDHDNIFYEIVFALSKTAKSKELLIALRDKEIDFRIKDYEKMLKNYYVKQMPLAHVVGSTTFMGLKFIVSKKVLAPRDVTQQMVNDFIVVHKGQQFHEVLDMGCGSGCIGISIKKFIPQFQVTCVDKYWAPLFDTVMNAKKNNVAITVDVKDAFEYLDKLSYVDILISNPPYINPKNFDNKKMFKYENKKALIAPEHGLLFFRKYFEYLDKHPFKEAWLEFGYDQKEQILALVKQYPNLKGEITEGRQYIVVTPAK